MKKVFVCYMLLMIALAECIGCENNAPQQATQFKDFAYVSTKSDTEGTSDITLLNRWLQANPNKKVVSFSGVLAYREGVNGYVVQFVEGANASQKFEQVNLLPESNQGIYGIRSLQSWKDNHPKGKIIGVATVPKYGGGVREFMICYEE